MSRADDVVVVGAGASGLFSAILLARLGRKVTVLEMNRHPGGLMRSYSRRGVDCPVGIHYLGSLGQGEVLRRVFDVLGVTARIPTAQMGTEGPVDRFITPTGRVFDVPTGVEAFADALSAKFPRDREHIARLSGTLSEAATFLHELRFVPGRSDAMWAMDHLQSMGSIADREGWSEEIQEILALATGWIGVPWGLCPEHLFTTSLSSYLSSAWRLTLGGAHMAEVLRDRLSELGGEIVLGEPVTGVRVEDRMVQGVETVSGRFFSAAHVVSSLHPAVTLRLLPSSVARPSYRKRILGLRDTKGCTCVHALVPSTRQPPRPYNVFLGDEQPGTIDMVFFQLLESGRPGFTLLTIIEPDTEDTWRAWVDTRTGNRDASYREAKHARAENLLQRAEEVLGPLGTVDLLDVYTPLSIRDWVGSPSGTTCGVSRDTSQQYRAALLHRTPIRGLHLTGQSVSAPGIIGTAAAAFLVTASVAGKEAVGRLLEDLTPR